ncbi:MAG: SusC/RagA family TonB-linked outer membrane protein [Gemmatimonadaceae bacterium]|nr:SusC/RagA family TonB-linked outer membrane protein [Gemmatimonadaceae bacterium]
MLLSFASADVVSAQGAATITGTVTNEAGQPLFGAGVGIEALAIQVGTGEDGRYTITIPGARVRGQQVVLRARLFGYAPQVKSITVSEGSQTHDFVLRQDVNRLSQVVVTGVAEGTEKTKVPFTVATVTAADMPVPGTNAFAQLQGKVAGVQITSTTGRPGSDPAILLRAPLSINGSGRGQGPLVIVDGIIFNGGINDVNPQDIESIEVVKGAAAASLYGSRAGNGVIQITTKKGKGATSDGIRFNVNTEYGQSDIEREYDLARATTIRFNETYDRYCVVPSGAGVGTQRECTWTTTMEQELRRVNDIPGPLTLTTRTFVGDLGFGAPPSSTRLRHDFMSTPFPVSYEPIKQLLTNGQFLNTNVSMSGRIQSANVYASLSNLSQEGSVRFLDGFVRNGFRLNADQQIGEDWTVSGTAFFSKSKSDGGNFVGSNNRVWFGLSRTPAFANILAKDSQGRYMPRHNPTNVGNQNYNPVVEAIGAKQINDDSRFLGSLAVKYRPVTWADAEWNFGYDYSSSWGEFLRDKGFRTSAQNGPQTNGSFSRSNGFSISYNTSLNLTMRRQLTQDINGTISLRYLYEQQDFKGDNLGGTNLVVAGLRTADAISLQESIGVGSSQSRISQIGIFLTGRLDYQGKLIFDGLIRQDGASVFGSDNRWQTYGRGSVLYRPSEEAWWPAKDIVNELKLRAAVGTAGNRPIFSAQYETLSIGSGGTLTPNVLGNPLLGPEVITETDIGFDAELFNRYGIEFSYINAKADNQILNVPTPAVTGFGSQWRNAGTLENKIIEAAVNVPILEGFRGVSWSARMAMDRPESKITQLDVLPYFVSAAGAQGTTSMFRIAAGNDYGVIYGRGFVTKCTQLPASFQARCGEGKEYQKNDDGRIVWVGAGNTWRDGITKNLWNGANPGSDSPWGVGLNWGMNIIERDSTGTGFNQELGSAIPSMRWSMGHNVSWNKFTGYILFDAVQGRSVFNLVKHWNYGDFSNGDVDQFGKSVENAKPIGYYWRGAPPDATGVGGLYDFLAPTSHTTEDASFVKLRELSVGYRIGRLGRYGDWTVNVVGRNLLTWSDYSGFDPETGLGGGSNGSGILNAADAFNFPNLRTFTLQFNVGF